MCINLRNCQYELFRAIALKELGWRVVDYRNKVIDEAILKQEEQQRVKMISENSQEQTGDVSTRSEKPNDQKNADEANKVDDGNQQYDESKNVMSASKLTKLQSDSKKQSAQMTQQEQLRKRMQEQQRLRELDPNNWDIFWADSGMTPEFLSSLANCQKANHFLGMYNICRKSSLGMHLKRFQKEFPDQYDFFPQTWMYPADLHEILEYSKKKTDKRKELIDDGRMTEAQSEKDPVVLFICKPESGSQGRGIFIASKVEEMRQQLNTQYEKNRQNLDNAIKIDQGIDTALQYSNPKTQNQLDNIMNRRQDRPDHQYIVQKYLKKPALYQGHKYDFRIYVLITSVISPMTIFLYNDGLVRLASQKYDPSKSYDDPYVHLTNYSLNKNSKDFDSSKHKLRLKDVLVGELVSQSSNGKTYRKKAEAIWSEIEQIVVKTLMVVQPQLQHLYRTAQAKEPDTCCDLLGFDVMLDHKLKPWMLEVNHMPSFKADTKLDYDVKHDMIKNTLQILQLSTEHRRQLEQVIKAEQRLAMQYGNTRRMTVKEHCDRVKFDYHLIDQYIPGNKFKRIYPLDPGTGGSDDLEDVYAKLERTSNTIWKKSVGMIQKKEINPNIHEKKKKRKNKKGLLTSMTSHIKAKGHGNPNQDDCQQIDDDDEEDPEDGCQEEAPEDGHGFDGQRRDSALSIGEGGLHKDDASGDLQHILSNRQSNSRRNTFNGKQNNLNQSQSKLSNGSSNLRGGNIRGISKQPIHTFVPLSEFGMPGLNYVQQTIPLQGLLPGNMQTNNPHRHFLQKSKNDQLASKSIQEELKNLQCYQVGQGLRNQIMTDMQQSYHPIPTLNEILTQLHQDPGFRQRYKEYCRAVLDGRFNFGGIKNPIYDHIYGGGPVPPAQPSTAAYSQAKPNGGQFAVIGQGSQQQQVPQGVTLLGQGIRQQARGQSTGAPYHSSINSFLTNTFQPGQSLNGIRGGYQAGKLEKLQQPPQQQTTSISEAAYFIQRVNKILQHQGEGPGQAPGKAHEAPPKQIQQQVNYANQYFQKGGYQSKVPGADPSMQHPHNPNFGFGLGSNSNYQNQAPQSSLQSYGGQKLQQKANGPYIGLAIQSVNASPNGGTKNQKKLISDANGSYIQNMARAEASNILGNRNAKLTSQDPSKGNLTATGTNFNVSQQKALQSAQKQKLRQMQETTQSSSNNMGNSQSQISTSQNESSNPQKNMNSKINQRLQMNCEQFSNLPAPQQQQQQQHVLNLTGGSAATTKNNGRVKAPNQDNVLQNVEPVGSSTDPAMNKKMNNVKFNMPQVAKQSTTRVLVAGGTGQVSTIQPPGGNIAQPSQEYVDGTASAGHKNKDGQHVIMSDQIYRKNQQNQFNAGLINKAGASASTAKSLNAMQGRFIMQQNNENINRYQNSNNAYNETSQNNIVKHIHGGSHHNDTTMGQQIRVSSKDGVRKKKSQSLARYQFKNI